MAEPLPDIEARRSRGAEFYTTDEARELDRTRDLEYAYYDAAEVADRPRQQREARIAAHYEELAAGLGPEWDAEVLRQLDGDHDPLAAVTRGGVDRRVFGRDEADALEEYRRAKPERRLPGT